MAPAKHSVVFNPIVTLWKMTGLWSDKTSKILYRTYSILFVASTSVLFFALYTLDLIYTPKTVEIFASQAVFYFSTLSGFSKTLVILIKRPKIISITETIDCKEFQGSNDKAKEYLHFFKINFTRYFKVYTFFCYSCAIMFLVVVPLINHYFGQGERRLPICQYYFLSDEAQNKYFIYLFIFQTMGLVATLVSSVTAHTYMCGLISMAIIQFKILNFNISNIRLDEDDIVTNEHEKEQVFKNKLYRCLKHYDIILTFCNETQDIVDFLMFAQYGLATLTLCFCMYMFLLDLSTKDMVFMFNFMAAMLLENYVPSLLGSQLTYESNNLRFAAYCCDWIPRPKSFKTSLMLLVERALRPVVITGLKMFPITLETFTSIVKTAYSFFTLLSGVQEQSGKHS